MKGGKPVAVCAAIALAAHAALLLDAGPRTGRHAATPTPAVMARLAVEVPAPAAEPAHVEAEAAAPTAAVAPVEPPATQAPAVAETAPPDAQPPAFADDTPGIGFPDAQLPAQGVQLRAYVELEADGSTRQVSTAGAPGAAPPSVSFQKIAEVGLRQARFKPGLGSAYCLLVRFEPDTPAPTLAWLPGAARDATRCLAGKQPAPRELESPAAP